MTGSLSPLKSVRLFFVILALILFTVVRPILAGLAAAVFVYGLFATPADVSRQMAIFAGILPPGAWEIFHATDPAGADVVRYIPQAYVTFKPKNAGGLQFDFGKFYTSAGAELTENNLTWNYGRGYLYTNGPYYHTGLRINKPVNDKFAVGLQIVNGWNNVEDNNSGKTFGFMPTSESHDGQLRTTGS